MDDSKQYLHEFLQLMNDGESSSTKHAVKATLFTDVFQMPNYSYQLYQALHPEDKTTRQDDVVVITLQNTMVNLPYNDLGLLIGDRLMIMVEAQTTWSVNILVRMLIYLAYTYKNYVSSHRYNIYSSTRVKLPKPEFYVLYTGGGKRTDEIRFSTEFFGGEDIDVEIRAKVIHDGNPGDVVSQYVDFTQILDRNVKKAGYTIDAAKKTCDECIEKGILSEYFAKRGKAEVTDLMMILFDEEVLLRNHDAELEQKVSERVRKEEQRRFSRESRRIKRETAEQVERETTERVERETTERVERETTERVERETTERIREEADQEIAANIRALMQTMEIPAEEAMKLLRIPTERRSHYAELLSQD